ncbi:MAG: hypothetical protein ACXVLQ_03360 [Bacteriovorax sp.]
MSSFISKKATAIYRASKALCLALWIFQMAGALAQTDVESFCFDQSVSMDEVRQSLNFLLLPKDHLELQREDHCIDVVTSPDRVKLFEKYLSKRYDLKRNARGASSPIEELSACRLDFKTTVKSLSKESAFKLGEKNALKKSEKALVNTSVTEILLGKEHAGEIEAGNEKLNVRCTPMGLEMASVVFSYADKKKSGVSAEVRLKKGEWMDIASVRNELHDKMKILGVPQTEISESNGHTETIYELQFK